MHCWHIPLPPPWEGKLCSSSRALCLRAWTAPGEPPCTNRGWGYLQQGLQEGTQRTKSGAGSWSRGHQGLVLDKDLQMELSSQVSQWAKPAALHTLISNKVLPPEQFIFYSRLCSQFLQRFGWRRKGRHNISPPALLHAHTILSRAAMGTNAGSSPTSQLQPRCSPCCPGTWRSVDSLCHFCTGICCSFQGRDFRSGNSPQFGKEDNSKISLSSDKDPPSHADEQGVSVWFFGGLWDSDWSREFKGILTASPPVCNLGQTSSMFL